MDFISCASTLVEFNRVLMPPPAAGPRRTAFHSERLRNVDLVFAIDMGFDQPAFLASSEILACGILHAPAYVPIIYIVKI